MFDLTNILLANFSLKNSGIVSIPSLVALAAISEAGSIPKTFRLYFLKNFNKVPSLLPMSTTRSPLEGE